ncbi:Uncharacterized protein TCM_027901 [Theobroma cacao]|uniref:Uncharacterized protein n=1 Tax=Theobroma cacao TaxID=3641 RepID=A0A061GH42_THECC|nr:Uncharacterized protein TCM_027901 [Theobroma cacao]
MVEEQKCHWKEMKEEDDALDTMVGHGIRMDSQSFLWKLRPSFMGNYRFTLQGVAHATYRRDGSLDTPHGTSEGSLDSTTKSQ